MIQEIGSHLGKKNSFCKRFSIEVLSTMRQIHQVIIFTLSTLVHNISVGQQGQSYKDINNTGEEHTVYNLLQGSWDVLLKIPIGNDKYIDGKSACEANWVLDGRVMHMEYNSTLQGKPLTVERYLGFDRYKNKYTEVHFESTHTDFMASEGTLSADQQVITCWGSHVDVATNQIVKVRTVTTFIDHNTVVLEMIYTDTDERDSKTITLTHKRKSK